MKIVADRTESSNYFILLRYKITFIATFKMKNTTISMMIRYFVFVGIMLIWDINPSGSLHLKDRSILKTKTASAFKTVPTYQTIWCCILHILHRKAGFKTFIV
jgi:hypothetical protein